MTSGPAPRAILSAAWDVAREHGLAAPTLREVATRVGMRAPSLYSHFASKHAIFDAMFGQAWEEYDRLAADSAGRLPDEPRGVLREIARPAPSGPTTRAGTATPASSTAPSTCTPTPSTCHRRNHDRHRHPPDGPPRRCLLDRETAMRLAATEYGRDLDQLRCSPDAATGRVCSVSRCLSRRPRSGRGGGRRSPRRAGAGRAGARPAGRAPNRRSAPR
ncbi:TetR/AcrR family transcriptional regulator [Pseudonocardia sp. DLS-67]